MLSICMQAPPCIFAEACLQCLDLTLAQLSVTMMAFPITVWLSSCMHAQPGVFDPAGLQRLDLILASAGNYGIKVIFPFVNFWADLGGMQW